MVLGRRRYQSLGLLKRSHSRTGPLEGVDKFVSESHVHDAILFNRVTRARPHIRQLEFANDDVDWPLEYCCETLGKWIRSLVGWLLGILESFMRFLGFRRKDNQNDKDKDTGKDNAKKNYAFLSDLNHSSGDGEYHSSNANNQRKLRLNPEIIWRFENCVPFLKRRFLKRKWFRNPATREWATRREELFQKHVKRGFRTLCSAVGKDTKIYVVCSASEGNSSAVSSSQSPLTYMFRADSTVLKAHSHLFRQWFEISGNDRKIVTSFVTPQEMQAVLLYMYTLTWPTDMVVPKKKGKGVNLNPTFLAVVSLYGMSLSLVKETPPEGLDRRSNFMKLKEEAPVDKNDENQNALLVDEKDFLQPVATVSSEGQGDCSQFVQSSADVIQYVTEKGSPNTSRNDLPSVASLDDVSTSSDRSSKVSKWATAKQFLDFSMFPSNHHRVHPESTSRSSHCSKFKPTAEVAYNSSVGALPAEKTSAKNIDDNVSFSRLDSYGFHIG